MNNFKFSKRFVMILAAMIMISIACTGVLNAFASTNRSSEDVLLDSVVVTPGDSLWSIASSHKPEGMDIRVYIEKLQDVNGMKRSEIQAGDILNLPSI
ncbi:peptidoglycan-binding LysM [Paenibacillus sp. CAA11]|uniref:LysM peptidoglycan-binding domain-containing protein n=1 Tax=Paenibacillus sp. CAA11 TaxID=1532905 RepID=UPI000D3D7082|nr:LysM peptidoglycan-binding domain-containing protein [Paenibacillus sp. CAA11]AWB46924.1 peptidoglycan-binding LysM [Paenibacillus sp. CAA11]